MEWEWKGDEVVRGGGVEGGKQVMRVGWKGDGRL